MVFAQCDNSQTREPPPGWLHPALTVACILSIVLPQGLIRLGSGVFIGGLFLKLVKCAGEQSRDAYLSGVSCALLVLRWIDLIAIHVPERDFWEKGTQGKQVHMTVWERLRWFFFLWNNQRGVGWNIQPDCLPQEKTPNCTRSMFVKESLVSAFQAYLGLDVVQVILKHFYATNESPFFAMSISKQIIVAWVAAFKLFYTITLMYSLGGALTVPTHMYRPADWPPIFGSFRQDSWSIRKMWGSCWHQMMRRPCAEAGRLTKALCGLRTGSFISRYSQIWLGFIVSAAIHHAGAIVGMVEDNGWWQGVFFLIQPVGIMLEDAVIGIGRRYGLKMSGWTKLLGHMWVLGWFSWSLRFIVAFQPMSWVETLTIPSLITTISSKASSG